MVIAICFYQFLIGRLWAEILTAKVWRKSVKSWEPQYFVDTNICDISAWGAGTNEPVQCGRESAHKSGAASGNLKLCDCMRRGQHLEENISEVWEKPANADFSRQKLLGDAPPDLYIICTPTFCLRIYFVDTYILLTPIFCRRLTFVDANILSTPNFCRHQYFVDA
jgi:hypothetical protein